MRILFIATQLPPFIGSGNVRALHYINYLHRLGNEIDVIAVDYPQDSIAYDKAMEDVFDEGVRVHRVNPGLLYNTSYTKKYTVTTSTKASKGSIKKKLGIFVKRNLLIPDPYVQWVQPAYKKAKDLIEKNKEYDCMFSMHETPSSHLVAYKIKKKFPHMKWVGYWSDPWNGDSLRENRSSFKRLIEEQIERKIVNRVDRLLFTTESTRALYVNKYRLNPMNTDIVYRGYDEMLYQDMIQSGNKPQDLLADKINILHTGTIYKQLRDITPLCKALRRLEAENKALFDRLHFIFIGQFDDVNDEKQLKSFQNVTMKPLIPYKEALAYTVFADVLLLYGNKQSTQVPGKVYEYVGSEAPILTILGDEKDELQGIMQSANKGPIILNEAEHIIAAIQDVTTHVHKAWKMPSDSYRWTNVAADLEKKLFT